MRSEPRITFSPRDGSEQRPANALPSLGGSPSPALDKPVKGDAVSSPYPKDTNPGH
jgi:hypothetical protein